MRLAALDALQKVVINDRKNLPGEFFDNKDFMQAMIANMLGEKNAVLQYGYADVIGVIVRSAHCTVLDSLIRNCMLPQALTVCITEAARRSASHSPLKGVSNMYVETIVQCVWTAAIIAENQHSHVFMQCKTVEKIVEAMQLM
jgi:hypothetical protein